MDNAATEAVKEETARVASVYMTEHFANASAIYGFSYMPKGVIETSKNQIASRIGAKPEEIFFTSGGSESDNWAIKGVADANMLSGHHIITTKIEHDAVLNSCHWLEKYGFEVTYLDVDENGIVNPADVENAITNSTILISVMAANNEIGTIQPIKDIGEIAHKHGILFHVDAVQAFCHIGLYVNAMNIDLMSMAGHKIGAPKGVGALYIRSGTKINPLIHGGSQENGMRAGTYNTPGIAGFGNAVMNYPSSNYDLTKKRDRLISGLLEIQGSHLNGSLIHRLPNNVNVRFDGISGEILLYSLGGKGIYCSAGSACAAGDAKPSHVLSAIGLSDKEARESIRLTISNDTTNEEIDTVIAAVKEIVERLRG